MTTPELPPLPEPVAYRDRHTHWDLYLTPGNSGDRELLFTADQMHAYALAYAAQCLEAAEDRIRALRDSHCRDANCSTNGLDCNYVCAWNDAIEILRAAQKGTA